MSLKLTVKKVDREYIVRITDDKNKVVGSYFTNDKEDANGTADAMIRETFVKQGIVVEDRRK